MTDTPANDLSRRLKYKKTWQAVGWMMVVIVVWLSLTPRPPQPPSFLGWDKAQHFVAYGGLMVWYGMSFARHWRWPLFLVCLGVALEFLQGLGGVRSLDPMDMVANTLGVGIGLILVATPLGQSLAMADALLAQRLNRPA